MIRIMHLSGANARTTTLPPWAAALGGLAAVAVGLAVLVLSAGLALLLAPLVIGGVFYARWRLKKFVREAQARFAAQQAARNEFDRRTAAPRGAGQADVIDGEFRVIDDPRRP
jgi:hypothetical protein